MTAGTVAAVAAAGAIGAPARYLLDRWVQARTSDWLAWGTLAVNVLGSFALGLVVGLVVDHAFPESFRVVAGVGFCGAFTTFSTVTYETTALLEEGAGGRALANAAAQVGLGCLAAGLGLALGAMGT